MFNDRFGLTEKVLDGNKTQTRRIVTQSVIDKAEEFRVEYYNMTFDALTTKESLYHHFFVEKNLGKLPYKVGEIVAVAQSYKEVFGEGYGKESEAGYNNKMFVKPELMPHQIQITGIKIERLRDIAKEDCRKEGVCQVSQGRYKSDGLNFIGHNPIAVYASLIKKISGTEIWDKNPFVFVYDFKLINKED